MVKPQSGQPKSAWQITAEHDSFGRLGHRLAVASTGLLAKPSQAKVLTGGGDLRQAQVDVPLSVSHSRV